MRFDHIGIFVADLDDGRRWLAALLPVREWTGVYEDPGLKVRVQFGLDASGVRYELVAPFGPGNPVDTVLKTGKGILNHVAYRVPDLEAAAQRLRAEGSVPLGPPAPAVAFGGRRVVFFFTPLRFVIELIESPGEGGA